MALARESFDGRVDAVVHSAGIVRNVPFVTMTEDDRDEVLRVHLTGAFDLTQSAFRVMAEQRHGRVVFTSSASGLFGRPNGTNYAMAKAGLIGLCNSVAIEGASCGILANAVLPIASTRLATPRHQDDQSEMGKMLQWLDASTRNDPAWVAPLVVYLASDRCDRTHRYYSAAQGRFAEVAVAVSSGWVAPGDAPPTVEALEANLDSIESLPDEGLEWPKSTADELNSIMRLVG